MLSYFFFCFTRTDRRQGWASRLVRSDGRCGGALRRSHRLGSRRLLSLRVFTVNCFFFRDLLGWVGGRDFNEGCNLRRVQRLSKITMVFGCHLTLAWKSWPVMMWFMRNSVSQRCSGSLRPWILVMNSPLMKRHFSPVTGWTRTSGWTVSTGSLRTRLLVRRAWLIILAEE